MNEFFSTSIVLSESATVRTTSSLLAAAVSVAWLSQPLLTLVDAGNALAVLIEMTLY